MKNSNLKDFDATRTDNDESKSVESASWANQNDVESAFWDWRHLFYEIILKEQGFIVNERLNPRL